MRTIQKYLVLILILVIGVSAIPGAAQDVDGNLVYLPLMMRNFPHHPIFGVEITSNGFMDDAALAGNHWVRYNGLLWSEVQPDNGTQFNWDTTLDTDLIAANEAGMEVVLIVRSTPSWTQKYTGYFCGPPADLNAFSNFMSNVVKRYSIHPYYVKYFEIWNEPDVAPQLLTSPTSPYGCWGNNDDQYYGGGYYADMLKVAYPAMKKANSAIKVVLGGLLLDCDPRSVGTGYCPSNVSTKPPKFFEGILRNGGGAYFDVVSFHGYPTYQVGVNPIQSEINFTNWSNVGGVVAGKLDYINYLLTQYKLEKPIFHTEGALLFPNENAPSTVEFERAKASYLPWLYARNWAKGIQATNWYTLNGPGWKQSALLDATQTPREAHIAFKLMSGTLSQAEFISYTVLDNGVHRFEFLTNNLRIWLLFSPDNNSRTVTVPAKFVKAYDIVEAPVTPVEGLITFSRPIYIEMTK